MKKVYGEPIGIFIGFIFFVLSYLGTKGQPVFVAIAIPFGTGLLFAASIVLNIIPFWKYDSENIFVWRFDGFLKGGWRKYSWGQVTSMRSANLSSVTYLSVGDSLIMLSALSTRNHLMVLSEICEYIKKQNKRAYISPYVLERIRNRNDERFKQE